MNVKHKRLFTLASQLKAGKGLTIGCTVVQGEFGEFSFSLQSSSLSFLILVIHPSLSHFSPLPPSSPSVASSSSHFLSYLCLLTLVICLYFALSLFFSFLLIFHKFIANEHPKYPFLTNLNDGICLLADNLLHGVSLFLSCPYSLSQCLSMFVFLSLSLFRYISIYIPLIKILVEGKFHSLKCIETLVLKVHLCAAHSV